MLAVLGISNTLRQNNVLLIFITLFKTCNKNFQQNIIFVHLHLIVVEKMLNKFIIK